QRSGIGERRALKTAHHGGTDGLGNPGIFTRAFRDAAPAGITGDIDHGSERPADAFGSGFGGGDAGGLFNQRGIPTGGLTGGDGKNGAVAVNDVAAEEQRNAG